MLVAALTTGRLFSSRRSARSSSLNLLHRVLQTILSVSQKCLLYRGRFTVCSTALLDCITVGVEFAPAGPAGPAELPPQARD